MNYFDDANFLELREHLYVGNLGKSKGSIYISRILYLE